MFVLFSSGMKKASLSEEGKKKVEVATCLACKTQFFYAKGHPEIGVEELYNAAAKRHKTSEEIAADKVKLVHFGKERCLCQKCLKRLAKALDEKSDG